MNKTRLVYTFFVIFICLQTYSQSEHTDSELNKMQKTYSFYLGQHASINEIMENYPSYKLKAKSAQDLWNSNFKASIDNIVSELKTNLGLKFKDYETELIISLRQIDYSEVTIDDIKNTIETVNNRAAGVMPSPYLETLLSFNPIYQVQPEEEMINGFISEYFTNKSTKADGLDIKIKYPKSWKAENGDRPHVVQKFTHFKGYEFGSALLMITKMDESLSKGDIDLLLSDEGLKYQIPDNSKVLSTNTGLIIDKVPTGEISIYYEQQQMKYKLGMISDVYIMYYLDYQITFMCTVGSTVDNYNETHKRYLINKKLFQRMANNLVFLSQYK